MHRRRLAFGAFASAAVLVVAASNAWACVSGPVLNLSTIQAKAGEQVTITGTGFRLTDPVQVRFNALDGPIIAEQAKPVNQAINATFTVPPATAPGTYVVIVTQARDGKLTLAPVRAAITVVGASGQVPILGQSTSEQGDRIAGLVRADNSVSSGTLALIALGVAGIGMFLAGIAALLANRRGSGAAAASVTRT